LSWACGMVKEAGLRGDVGRDGVQEIESVAAGCLSNCWAVINCPLISVRFINSCGDVSRRRKERPAHTSRPGVKVLWER
jgi:hypothetical protein